MFQVLRLEEGDSVFAEESFRRIGDTEVLTLKRIETSKKNASNVGHLNANTQAEERNRNNDHNRYLQNAIV